VWGAGAFEDLRFQIPLEREKSHAERSGDLAGHVMSQYLEITWLGNKFLTAAMESRAVWVVAPSCWKTFLHLLDDKQAQDLRISPTCERNVVQSQLQPFLSHLQRSKDR